MEGADLHEVPKIGNGETRLARAQNILESIFGDIHTNHLVTVDQIIDLYSILQKGIDYDVKTSAAIQRGMAIIEKAKATGDQATILKMQEIIDFNQFKPALLKMITYLAKEFEEKKDAIEATRDKNRDILFNLPDELVDEAAERSGVVNKGYVSLLNDLGAHPKITDGED